LQLEDEVEPFTAIGLNKEPITVSYSGPTASRVLLYFTPACSYCNEQIFYWRQLLDKLNPDRFQILGLVDETESRNQVEEYLRQAGCEGMQVAFTPENILAAYKLSVTPTTLVVSNRGKIQQAWIGQWDNKVIDEASSFFECSLSTKKPPQ